MVGTLSTSWAGNQSDVQIETNARSLIRRARQSVFGLLKRKFGYKLPPFDGQVGGDRPGRSGERRSSIVAWTRPLLSSPPAPNPTAASPPSDSRTDTKTHNVRI